MTKMNIISLALVSLGSLLSGIPNLITIIDLNEQIARNDQIIFELKEKISELSAGSNR